MAEVAIINERWHIRKLFQRPGSEAWYADIWDARSRKLARKSASRLTRKPSEARNRAKALQAFINWCKEATLREEIREDPNAIESVRFSVAYEKFLEVKAVRDATRETYVADGNKYARGFEDRPVDEIESGDVEKFLAACAKEGRSVRTRKKHLGMLRAFFLWAVRNRLAAADPTKDLRVTERRVKREGTRLTLGQARTLLESARKPTVVTLASGEEQRARSAPWLYTALLLAFHTGLRRNAIANLRWRDVDLGAGKITVPGQFMKAGNVLELPIHPELEDHLRERARAARKVEPDAPVIGSRVTASNATLAAACRRAGVLSREGKPIGWHDCRRSFATWYALRVPHAVVKALMGHAASDVTGLYVAVPFEELRKAVDAFPRILEATVEPASTVSA